MYTEPEAPCPIMLRSVKKSLGFPGETTSRKVNLGSAGPAAAAVGGAAGPPLGGGGAGRPDGAGGAGRPVEGGGG